MHMRVIAGVLWTCLVAAPVAAADLGPWRSPAPPRPEEPSVVPPPSRAPIWQGLYLGLSGGYGWGDTNQVAGVGATDRTGADPEGFVGSVTVGYNYMLGSRVLIGVEGDLGVLDISADDKELAGGAVYRASFGPLWGTVRGRAGLAMGPLLIYGTGGLAFASVDEYSLGAGGETISNRDLRSGWVAGGGVEFAFSQAVSTKLEYLHMDFGSYEGMTQGGQSFSYENTVDVVRAGVNIRF